MIRHFLGLSIRKKLALVTLFTSLVALLLASGTILTCQMFQMRNVLARELTTQAEIVGANCSAALAFQDLMAAHESLRALQARPDLVAAILFDHAGESFVEFRPHGAREEVLPKIDAGKPQSQFHDGYFIVVRPIYLGVDQVGSIALVSNLREQNQKLLISAAIMVIALVAAVTISIILSLKLQHLIADPLLSLAALARRITEERDYSLRATAQTQDEMGVLVDGINRMLTEIQKRDTELRESEERFRELAETIREVFWITDVRKMKVLYISPGYEQIWGRPCKDLYENPDDWIKAIHPDDLDRVQSGAFGRQAEGQYDEEYRIVRPDGSVRWIHDRAFAIRNAFGEVYRLAGIAEDITAKKQLEKQLLEISDREQSRIGQDLHDGLSQYLVRIGFAANVLLQELEQERHPEAERARKIIELVDRCITQARNLARGLYPVKLETEGLQSSLEELAATVSAEHGVLCEVTCIGNVQVSEYAVAIHLYRIAQEAVTNSIKHGNAQRIEILLKQVEGRLTLSISDDGKGLVKNDQGMGLHIMNYRARMIGAALEVVPRPEGGTLVSCVLQLPSANRSSEFSEALTAV